jgi:hypothetical protein
MPSNIPALPAGFSDERIVPPSMVEVLKKLAHPARFELTTSAFGGHSTYFFWGFLVLSVN